MKTVLCLSVVELLNGLDFDVICPVMNENDERIEQEPFVFVKELFDSIKHIDTGKFVGYHYNNDLMDKSAYQFCCTNCFNIEKQKGNIVRYSNINDWMWIGDLAPVREVNMNNIEDKVVVNWIDFKDVMGLSRISDAWKDIRDEKTICKICGEEAKALFVDEGPDTIVVCEFENAWLSYVHFGRGWNLDFAFKNTEDEQVFKDRYVNK